MKHLSIILLVLLFAVFVSAQNNDTPQANKWKGVILDETVADSIIGKFGKPKKDEKSRIFVQTANSKEFSQGLVKKKFRVLKYEEIEQAEDVQFVLNDNNVLILIEYKPQKGIPVQAFLNAYQLIDFQPTYQTILGKVDNTGYFLQGTGEKAIITAMVSKGILSGSILGRVETNTQAQSNKTLTGDIKIIQLISKSLLNKANTDVLK